MTEFTHWRDFDLTARRAKIERAFNRETVASPDDVPVMINTPCYFAFGSKAIPDDYFTNPASMVEYQASGYEKHLARVNDDYMPYFMPWFGTGVLASGFGCRIKLQPGTGNDPAVAEPCIRSPADAARLRIPDPYRNGWMPRVLDAIDYARTNSDLPPGLTDMQGPLDTLGMMCGQAQLYEWMYKEPPMVHELFELVTQAFIQWVKVQKQHIGEPLERSNGLQGVWSPHGVGIWESDDDLVLLDPGLYSEFVVPYVSRIFETFGGGSVHFCGNGVHHIENLLHIRNLRVVNNSPLGDFKAFGRLKERLGHRVTLQIQDASPVDVESYYTRLFAEIDDFRGIILAPFVIDSMGMDQEGGYLPVDWDPFETANRIVAITRECARKKLAGEPILSGPAKPLYAVIKPEPPSRESHPELSPGQASALEMVQDRLVHFDATGMRSAVHLALETGVRPFTIVTSGMAEGMAEVGRLYEAGDFFLPQLVMAAATMREGMAVLEPMLKGESATQSKGVIVIGTVQGDLHDIGKNIVKTLLEAAGFRVHDIGVDQPTSSFLNKARETGAQIIAMSALLTTTMPNMAKVIEALKEAGLGEHVKVMVGGAPISRQYADQIGAEGYAADAVKAVREATRLLECR